MKIKEGFILRTVGGENVVLPTGDNLDLSVMITLNDTGKFLWEHLQEEKTEEQLLGAVMATYKDVDEEEAKSYIDAFIAKLKEYDFLA